MPKVFITGDTTVSGVARLLRKQLHQLSPEFSLIESGYNQWLQDFIDPGSSLASTRPDIAIILLSPRLLTESEDAESRIDLFISALEQLNGVPRILCSLLYVDPETPLPLQETIRLQKKANEINRRLFAFNDTHSWFSLIDLPSLIVNHGLRQLTDRRYEMLGRMYFSPEGAEHLSSHLARCVSALTRTPRKVLVLDLDNTLWGGVLGEDGADGLRIGDEGVGHAFRCFQKAIHTLKTNGTILAICSKNNEADALKALREHPNMLLRIEDFSAYRINWLPKVENIRSIAEELNLGLDSFVFFDDSPFEREQMRKLLPQVYTIEVPADPSFYVQALARFSGFDTFHVTKEDRARARKYQEEAKRRELLHKSASLEEFYQSLGMQARFFSVTEKSFQRVHQLIWKTNQFNLTTRRYDESELRQLLESQDCRVFALQLSDKLGESGLTGVAVIRTKDMKWEIENLLLSCRIIGRTAEYAFMRWIARQAAHEGASFLLARFLPSGRNQIASDYLPHCGFTPVPSTDKWQLDLRRAGELIPRDFVQTTEDQPQ